MNSNLRLVAPLLAAVVSFSPVLAGASPVAAADADRAAIQSITKAWMDGYNGRDAKYVAALYTPDAWYLTQHFATGIVQGRDRIQAYVQNGIDARYQDPQAGDRTAVRLCRHPV